MPRPNRTRSIASEENLARRIAYEREQRRYSFAGLASRMTGVGCAIDQSALYKIENGNPRRRISVDELVALSEVFKIPVNDLLIPPELVTDRKALKLLAAYRDARTAVKDAWLALADHVTEHPRVEAILEEHITNDDISIDVFQSSVEDWKRKFGHLDVTAYLEQQREETKPTKRKARNGQHPETP